MKAGEKKDHMAIMIVSPYFHPRAGGVENYSYEVARRLRSTYDMKVSVVCCDWDNTDRVRRENIEGLSVWRIPYWKKFSSTPIGLNWSSTIESIVKEEEPDLINGHTPVPLISDIASRVSARRGLPFVLTYHNDLVKDDPLLSLFARSFHGLVGRRTLELSNLIVVTSEHYARSSRALCDWLNKVRIVSPGINPLEFLGQGSISDRNGGTPTVLFVGHISRASRHKGLDHLLEAIDIVNKEVDVRLAIVGGGDHIDHYSDMARKMGIEDRVEFKGRLSREQLISELHACDMLVLPSTNRSEGFGIVLLEAQACGKPVIGSNVGGIPSAMVDGETGLLVPPADPIALAGAIKKLIEDRAMASMMGRAGRERVERQFTWDESARRFHDIILEVLAV